MSGCAILLDGSGLVSVIRAPVAVLVLFLERFNDDQYKVFQEQKFARK